MVTDRFTDEANPLKSWRGCCLTMGNFDGVHKGHGALLEHLRQMASGLGGQAVALTFHPHPVTVLTGKQVLSIQTLRDRVEGLLAKGADGVWAYPFTREFAEWSPAEFVDRILVQALHVQGVIVGPDFRFGAHRRGTPEALLQIGSERGFQVQILSDPVVVGGETVSSSRIRTLLALGEMEKVESMMGAAYRISGVVQHGAGVGHKLGFPTANILPTPGLVLPPPGVYASEVSTPDGATWRAALFLGSRPTLNHGPLAFEAHLLDFQGDLYGASVDIRLRHLVRYEERFDSAEALVQAIHADLAQIRSWFDPQN